MPTYRICVFEHQERRDGKFPVSIRLTHNRQSAYIKTDIYVTRKQIAADFKSIRDTEVVRMIDRDIIGFDKLLLKGLGAMLSKYTARELADYIKKHLATDGGASIDFVAFSNAYIRTLRKAGRNGVAGLFEAVIRNLIDYFERPVIYIKEINVINLQGFIEYMQSPRTITRINQHGKAVTVRKAGCKAQTVKDYMTDLQTLFNAACEEYNDEDAETALITHWPFSSKKLKIDVKEEPEKRDLSVEDLVRILKTETLPGKRMQLARDVLALSFYLLAMNTADLYGDDAALTFRRITYHRQKTASRRKDEALLSVKIEPEALSLIRKYRDPNKKRLFCFYRMYADFRGFNQNVNKGCKQLAEYLGVNPDLSSYYMRHTWATVASEDCGISDAEIAMALNHVGDSSDITKSKSLKVTRGYIHRRFTKNDVNHRKVLDFVKSKY